MAEGYEEKLNREEQWRILKTAIRNEDTTTITKTVRGQTAFGEENNPLEFAVRKIKQKPQKHYLIAL